MEGFDLVIVGMFVVMFALVSARLSKTFISAPMIFVGFGLLVGPEVLDVVDLDLQDGFVHTLAEITLIIVLYSDASRIDLGVLRRNVGMPLRLLGLGLPLTIALGIVVGYFLFDEIGIWGVAILAAILAPTDAALGQAVVSDKRIPVRIRQALNVESGLNDGIALPLVLLFLAAAEETAQDGVSLGGLLREHAGHTRLSKVRKLGQNSVYRPSRGADDQEHAVLRYPYVTLLGQVSGRCNYVEELLGIFDTVPRDQPDQELPRQGPLQDEEPVTSPPSAG
ncbi:MAG: cation:proton antiporter [Chloroflexi bacterium]|nr:cation:proton antiporter [Chloroflexota bacterium]